MSVLTVLCFASFLYLSLADPLPPAVIASQVTQEQISAIVSDIKKVVELHLEKQLKELDDADRKYLTDIALDGIFEYINFVETLVKQNEQKIEGWSKKFLDGHDGAGKIK